MAYRTRKDCRLCGALLPTAPSLTLTPTPPANEFVTEAELDVEQECFPLALFVCADCKHVQLPYVVNPERLFRDYVYVSGTSPIFVKHFEKYAEDMIERCRLTPGDLVVEIGSNDGTLLRFFKKHGMRILGIDPADKIAKKASIEGITTLSLFFTETASHGIRAAYGQAKLVVANNVFAHADDLHDIARGVRHLIGDDGFFVLEVSDLNAVVKNCLFDTIYHEHLSYHSIRPLSAFFDRLRMGIYAAESVNTHGGSLRVLVRKRTEFQPRGITSGEEPDIRSLAVRIEFLKRRLTTRLHQLKAEGKKIAAFGAPAKATTLMYHFDLGKDVIDFVVDDSPLKQGLYTPGKHVPVVPSSMLYMAKPDYTVILAWNFAESIIVKHNIYLQQGGTFIVPIPDYYEVNSNGIHTG